MNDTEKNLKGIFETLKKIGLLVQYDTFETWKNRDGDGNEYREDTMKQELSPEGKDDYDYIFGPTK